MSTTTSSSRTSSVQWLIESRPPSLSWSRPSPPQSNQPPLDFADHEPDHLIALPNDRQRDGLPDARQWSTALASAVIQALLAQRPVAHPILSKSGFRPLTWSDRSTPDEPGRSGQWPAALPGRHF
jgi:hypothetical protein